MFASRMDFRKGQTSKKAPPKRGCQVGGTPSKKDHYSLAESSKYVQIEVAFIPRTTNIECSRGDQRIQQGRAVPKRDDSSPLLPPHHQGYHPGRHPRPSFECLSLCVSLAQREFGLPGRDCRTTKIRKRDARAAIAANGARIRLCVKTVVARLAQSPGTSGRICTAVKSKTRDTSDS